MTPVVSWILSPGVWRANSVFVTITGQSTNFAAGSTQVNAGVVVSNVTIINSTTLSAQLTAAINAQPGPRSIALTTANEEATLPNGFHVW